MRLMPLMLLVVCCSANADWVPFSENTDGSKWFIEVSTIYESGSTVRFWVLQNLTQKGQDGELSKMSYREIDCKERKHRGLQYEAFSEPMGKGTRLWKFDSPGDWSFINPQQMTFFLTFCPK